MFFCYGESQEPCVVLAYNSGVPTPFYHLSLADQLLQHEDLPQTVGAVLTDQRCAFFFGKTAPDVQSISGQPRPETHFYWLPLGDQVLPWKQMLKRYPELADTVEIGPERAAFTAGYLCHLQADILWIEHIFWPYFIGPMSWKKRKREKIFIHNVLRAYLDDQILTGLPKGLSECLGKVNPNGWLPVVENEDLSAWRDFLAEQLSPDGVTQTVEVFARRQGISAEEFSALLYSEERLEVELFSFIPRDTLVEYREAVIADNLLLLEQYFSGSLNKD
jgi:hypothetical protein